MAAQRTEREEQTGPVEKAAYGAYFAGQNITYFLIQGYLLTYYVSQLNFDPALVGTLFLVVRVWDAVNDPLIGLMMDRVRLGGSRFKTWLNFTAFLMPLATFALFLAPTEAAFPLKLTYAVVTYLVWDVLYTMSEVPIFSVSTAMTKNARERDTLLTLTQIGSVLGVAAGTIIADQLLGEGVEGINWVLFGGIPSALAVVFMIPQIFAVKERFNTEVVEGVGLVEMIREVLRNDQHLIIMTLYLSQAFNNAVTGFAIYVAQGYYGEAQLATRAGLFSLVGIIGLGVVTPRIIRRIGKQRYLQVTMLATILFSIPLFFIPGSMPYLAMVFFGIRTATLVVTSLLRPMFTADAIEYGEAKTGVRNDSTAFAIQTFFNKTGDAIGAAFTGYILGWVGFNEQLTVAQQSASTINSLQVWFVVLPMLMAATFLIGVTFFYRLDERTVRRLVTLNEEDKTPIEDPLAV
jgi:sugar (glycoside-pentoside-hexuronide) transporter